MQLKNGRKRKAHPITYVLLFALAFIALFPLYWLLITSFKQPIAVFQGPKFIPWVDFQPTLSAWKFLLTGPGHEAYDAIIRGTAQYTRDFLSTLQPDEQATLHKLLLKASHGLGFDWQ